jgi:predicted peroxiredoxin
LGEKIMPDSEKLLFIFTAAGDRAEDAVTGITLATVSLSMGSDVVIALLGYGTLLAKQGYAETVHAPERQPFKKLLTEFMEGGGRVLCCMPCIKGRKMELSELVQGVEAVTAVTISEEIAAASKVISF